MIFIVYFVSQLLQFLLELLLGAREGMHQKLDEWQVLPHS